MAVSALFILKDAQRYKDLKIRFDYIWDIYLFMT